MSSSPAAPVNRLRELRDAAGMARKTVAAHVDRDSMTIYRWETGSGAIPDDCKLRLADLFGVSVEWLMGWDRASTPEQAA